MISYKTLICVLCILSIGLCSNDDDKWICVYDLFNENCTEDWQSDLALWETTPNVNNPITTCGDDQIVGGYRKFGRKLTFETINDLPLPAHSEIRFTFDIFAIDTWDPNGWDLQTDYVAFLVDDVVEHLQLKDWANEGDHMDRLCGGNGDFWSWKDYIYSVDIDFEHCDLDIALAFVSQFDERKRNESWGINNLKIYVNDPTWCPDGYYFDGVCKPCFFNCAKCSSWHICEECKNSEERVLPTCWCKWGLYTNKKGEQPGDNGECYEPECESGETVRRFNHKNEYECVAQC